MDSKIWTDLVYPDISIVEKILRPIIVYLFLVVGLRLAGKRELAQLNTGDLIVLLTLSNTVQNAIIGNDNSVTGGVIGATTLLIMNFIWTRFLFSHEKLNRLAEGDPDVLIDGGAIKLDRLKKEQLSRSELEIAAHKQGFTSLDEIDRAVLEPGGTITFVGKKPSAETERHNEMLGKLEQISKELAALRASNERLTKPGS
ncbi:MAG TPA: YetF domain-containing protein [Blastocatellia bacterium]|nr:YetF domain-containing protein [Blastocatellia bacterium]